LTKPRLGIGPSDKVSDHCRIWKNAVKKWSFSNILQNFDITILIMWNIPLFNVRLKINIKILFYLNIYLNKNTNLELSSRGSDFDQHDDIFDDNFDDDNFSDDGNFDESLEPKILNSSASILLFLLFWHKTNKFIQISETFWFLFYLKDLIKDNSFGYIVYLIKIRFSIVVP